MQNLLLVDDEPHILATLKRLLRPEPYTVFTAQSAQQAYAILAQNDIQVMVTDYKMPGEDGADLIASVSQRYPEIVSLMLSGQADYERVVDLLSTQAALGFVKKPWSNPKLIDSIRNAFTHHAKQTHSSWQKRINALSQSVEQHTFEGATRALINQHPSTILCLMQLSNATDIAHIAGQASCEHLQTNLFNFVQNQLPATCVSHCYAPGLVAFCFAQNETFESTALFSELQANLSVKVEMDCTQIQPALRIAYQTLSTENVGFDTLIEELKDSLQATSALDPVFKLSDEYRAQLSRQRTIRHSIRPQLDSGRFSIAVQPKISVPSNIIESAEVLLRWQHSTLGWLPPGEFIRLAEMDGQIKEIGNWVMQQGIALAAKLTRAHPQLKTLAINVSSRQLYSDDFIPHLEHTRKLHNLAANKIELEITETFISEDMAKVAPILQRLNQLEYALSIDDFGAGSTAFNFLTNLPVNTLKLDRCLVTDIAHCDGKRTLVQKLIECCHALDISVVAEGVEDQATLAVLQQFGCDKIQGFIFSPAVSPNQFELLLVNQPYSSKVGLLS